MRLRVLETNAGTVLVLDRCTPAFVAAAAAKGWPEDERPFIFAVVGDVEIPESDNYHPPAKTKTADLADDIARVREYFLRTSRGWA